MEWSFHAFRFARNVKELLNNIPKAYARKAQATCDFTVLGMHIFKVNRAYTSCQEIDIQLVR